MLKGVNIFTEIATYLNENKPQNVTLDEVNLICCNYGRLCGLMDSVFSTLHSKWDTVTEEKINTLKSDLDLVRIKWNEINISFTTKFHVLYEHVPDLLLDMNAFYDMGEDTIERWHQIRMRHYARIRSLRSLNMQKQNQAKYECTQINQDIAETIAYVKEQTKRKRDNNTIALQTANDTIKNRSRPLNTMQ